MIATGRQQRILWLVRSLAGIGLVLVVMTLALVGVTLAEVRAERARSIPEQARLSQASDVLRQRAIDSRIEIQSMMDETIARTDHSIAVPRLLSFVREQLDTHPDAAMSQTLTQLNTEASNLLRISRVAEQWRDAYDVVWTDTREERTLGTVRGLVARMRNEVAAREGVRRLEEATRFVKWRKATGEEAARDARALVLEHARQQSNDTADLNDQLAELTRLVELLGGAEQLDSLADIRDNLLRPALDRASRTMAALSADPASAGTLSPAAVDDLTAALFGNPSIEDDAEPATDIRGGGLFALRRDALVLRNERKKLENELAGAYQEIEAAIANFAQSTQARTDTLTRMMESHLAEGWHSMLVFGGTGCAAFLWLAFVIGRGIKGQVNTIELARAEAELGRQTTQKLMIEQQAAAVQLAAAQQKLLEASRQAGMAEIATSVLHNVGNVLNSVNVSVSLATTSIQKSPVKDLARAIDLIKGHKDDLGSYLTQHAQGQRVPAFLEAVAEALAGEQESLLTEMASLARNVEHINQIVRVQQSHAGVSAVAEEVRLADVLEDALRVNMASLEKCHVEVVREFTQSPALLSDKHAILQILINLLSNARHAVMGNGLAEKRLTLRTAIRDRGGRDFVNIEVTDNGVGIEPANVTRIFNHGFTTKRGGHGFGLHYSANAARQLGGSLTAFSDGPGKGATFTLALPLTSEVTAL